MSEQKQSVRTDWSDWNQNVSDKPNGSSREAGRYDDCELAPRHGIAAVFVRDLSNEITAEPGFKIDVIESHSHWHSGRLFKQLRRSLNQHPFENLSESRRASRRNKSTHQSLGFFINSYKPTSPLVRPKSGKPGPGS